MSAPDPIALGLAARANAILAAAGSYAPAQALIERLNREGDPIANAAMTTYTTFPTPTGAGTAAPVGFSSPAPGRALFLAAQAMFSSTPITGRMQIATGASSWAGTGTAPLMDVGFACGPQLACPPVSLNVFLRSSDRFGGANYVTRWLDAAVTGTHYVGSQVSGFTLADSINFDARKVILFLGDSIWNGTGPTTVSTCIPWLVNKFYRDQGIDSRYILKAYSGSTSSGHESYRQGGKYDFPQLDAIFYNLGANDAIQGYATDGASAAANASMPNLRALIGWKQKRYPKAKLVICGPTPLQNAAYEATLAALRAAQASAIAALGDPTILHCNLGNSFDRTVDANYVASDGAGGTRVHPADAGLTQQWAGGYNGNAGLAAWLAANLARL